MRSRSDGSGMAIGAFPLAKLGFVLVKQISKPIANGIASRARKSKLFRNYICIPVAQFFHWYDVKIRMRVLNLGKVTSVPKLDEKKAIETGAQVISYFINFGAGFNSSFAITKVVTKFNLVSSIRSNKYQHNSRKQPMHEQTMTR